MDRETRSRGLDDVYQSIPDEYKPPFIVIHFKTLFFTLFMLHVIIPLQWITLPYQ